ncbi:glycosyltransferase [Oryzicola mucosus]|uniref:Glycosyltransferase n=1 Tax=Oryzicola mucosus TaxID=2767425 RepID=A0A8J6PWS2_9HYPH|nr:glycosyltransferase [Oryzicola mucosus]MBD0415673.1 glycosyltransferase [Oryzicola mucosus]
MELPRLSVIIPHLNEPGDLIRCLRSLDAQRTDISLFEIIVVDNGSKVLPTDACKAIPNVRLERELTPGPGPARNRGASVARADLLAFIDADCLAEPGWARSIIDFMDAHPDVAFLGGAIGIIPSDPGRLSGIEAYERVYSYRAKLYVERHGFAATGNMAVRADVFRAVGPFGGIAAMEDTEWGQKATAAGWRAAYLGEAKVLTPSCKSFSELARRWDRHVAHEFRKIGGGHAALARWIVTSILVAASPLAAPLQIMRTEHLSGPRSRWLALVCLTKVRLYRARRMLDLALHHDTAKFVGAWNREKS